MGGRLEPRLGPISHVCCGCSVAGHVAHILLDSINHLRGKKREALLGCLCEYFLLRCIRFSGSKLSWPHHFLLTCRALAPPRLTLISSVTSGCVAAPSLILTARPVDAWWESAPKLRTYLLATLLAFSAHI